MTNENSEQTEPKTEDSSLEGTAVEVNAPLTLEEERDQFKAIAQRTQADFVNYKRRVEEERGVLARNATSHVITRLLPIVDDLRRASDAIPPEAPDAWTEGVRMVHQNLISILESEGLSIYEPTPGDAFDPAEQEALYYQPTDEQAPGTVLSIIQPGYRTASRVLRPAQVIVAKSSEDSESDIQNR